MTTDRARRTTLCILSSLLILWGTTAALAQDPAEPPSQEPTAPPPAGIPAPSPDELPSPPTGVKAYDTPSDSGRSLTIEWSLSADDGAGRASVVGYEILRAISAEGPFDSIGFASAGQAGYVDPDVEDSTPYFYRVVSVTADDARAEAPVAGPAVSRPQWFNLKAWNVLMMAVILFAAIIFYIERGRRGHPPFVRRIAGLDALEEAIGRATEMGRPIVYVPGLFDMNEVQTVASMTILGHVGRKTAAYETRLMVPNRFSLVMTTARETVKEAALQAGRPDSYREDDIFYVSDEQFGFVAGTTGLMVREKPAACLYLGAFFAESLILAETGNSIGAIQIAGTAMPAQLPFFVAACDYTLIGEELFAASAYLSGEAKQLGSLKGQDIGKLVAMAGLAVGTLAATGHAMFGWSGFLTVFDLMNRLFSNIG